jgi:hypothetical protein
MIDTHALTGLILNDRDGFCLQAVENARMGGTVGEIATMLHLCDRSREIGAGAALLLALAGLDEEATAIARGETDGVPPAVRHALPLVGLHGIDAHVALAIAPVMDDCSVTADLGPHPGASVAWWEDRFTVWTPGSSPGLGNTGLGLSTDRTAHIAGTLPETVAHTLRGRPLRDLALHPMVLADAVVESVSSVAGSTTIHLRR